MNNLIQRFELREPGEVFDKDLARKAWKMLNQIRVFEEKSVDMYKQGLMGGSLHSSLGQEAVAVGIGLHLRTDDYMTMTYRGRGQAIAKGADPYRLYAEMMGRKDGYCKGKGGPMHIASAELGILGANGIVGAGIPLATGGALAAKHYGKEQLAVTFFGDGATNQGVFHEALNLAAVLKLPMIFVCENNLYSEMTPIRDSVLNEDLAERGAAYRIPSLIVDGNDVVAVYGAAQQAVERARNGEGPTLIEAKTYRLLGHMFGDAETYRSKEEVAQWRDKEPLLRFRSTCLEHKWMKEEELEQVRDQVEEDMEDALSRAKDSAEPDMEEVFTDVY